VEKIWSKPCNTRTSLDKIQQKLKLIKQYFKGWGFSLQGELRKQRKLISEKLTELESLEDLGDLSARQVREKMQLTKESLQLLDQEETL